MRIFVTLALIFQLIFSSVAYGRTVNSFSNTNYFKSTLVTNLGTTQLTLSGLVNAGLDGVISSGLSSAVYGTDFGAGVVDAITRAVVMGVAGASIQEVSDLLGHDVASLEKTIAKATINCLAAQANGASCASGALGTLVVDLGLGDALKLAELGPDEAERRMKIAALVVGFLTSEGKGANVDATLAAAQLDFDNNLLPAIYLLAIVGGALTAADVVLTANDAYNLAREGLACDGGDTAACARVLELSKQFAIEAGVTLTVGAIVPGDKIGVKIIAMMRKKGDDEVLEALDRATVWDNIKSTAGNLPNTQIPSTFKLKSGDYEFYVNSNATKHMGEYLEKSANPINDQQLLASFSGAVDQIASSGNIRFDQTYRVNGWEIIFNQRVGDELPVIKHALYLP